MALAASSETTKGNSGVVLVKLDIALGEPAYNKLK